jgi:hypothetical protein
MMMAIEVETCNIIENMLKKVRTFKTKTVLSFYRQLCVGKGTQGTL